MILIYLIGFQSWSKNRIFQKINNFIYPRPKEQTIGFDQLILKEEYEKIF